MSIPGIDTNIVATSNIINKGHPAISVFQLNISIVPNTISDIISIHAKNPAIGNPRPPSIPVIPAGFISFPSPGIRNNRPKAILSIVIPYVFRFINLRQPTVFFDVSFP